MIISVQNKALRYALPQKVLQLVWAGWTLELELATEIALTAVEWADVRFSEYKLLLQLYVS